MNYRYAPKYSQWMFYISQREQLKYQWGYLYSLVHIESTEVAALKKLFMVCQLHQ